MRRISVSGGHHTLVDDCDYEELVNHTWSYHKGYAITTTGPRSKRIKIRMHNLILKPRTGFLCDHIDGDGLNNQRFNLRESTIQQNTFNARARLGTSPYKGVSWATRDKRWCSHIKEKGKQVSLGRYANEKDAAIAYDKAAMRIQGEFARLNFPEMWDDPVVICEI